MIRLFSRTRWMVRNHYIWFLRRRPFDMPSCIYEGLPGSGKTLAMVRDCVKWMREGYTVASNLRIRDALTGVESLPCRTWIDMLRIVAEHKQQDKPIIVALDEIHLLCDAREWANTPAWWRDMMSQKRKHKIGLIGTTQALSQVEKRLRTLVAYMVRLDRIPPDPAPWAGWVFAALCACVAPVWVYLAAMRPDPSWIHAAWLLLAVVASGGLVPVFRKLGDVLAEVVARLPLFVEVSLDPSGVDVPGEDFELRDRKTVWMPWYAYHSFDTFAALAPEDMSQYSDDELRDEINTLVADLRNVPEREIPAWSDEELALVVPDPDADEREIENWLVVSDPRE